jgi:hypothetical protein
MAPGDRLFPIFGSLSLNNQLVKIIQERSSDCAVCVDRSHKPTILRGDELALHQAGVRSHHGVDGISQFVDQARAIALLRARARPIKIALHLLTPRWFNQFKVQLSRRSAQS